MMDKHELKTWPKYFTAIYNNSKTFEFRENDRNYKVGDALLLKEWCPRKREYTGREAAREITYLMTSGFGLPEGMCILGLKGGNDD